MFRCILLRAFVGKYIEYMKIRDISNKICYKNRAINTTVTWQWVQLCLYTVVQIQAGIPRLSHLI
jgi:hypothetical protein